MTKKKLETLRAAQRILFTACWNETDIDRKQRLWELNDELSEMIREEIARKEN